MEQVLEGLPELNRLAANEIMQIERDNYLLARPYEHNEKTECVRD